MANTFVRTTKSSLLTADVTSSATTNVLTIGATATAVVIGILVSNKTGNSANFNLYLSAGSGDPVFFARNVPVPAGSSLELMTGNKIVLASNDVVRAGSDTASALDLTISYLSQT